MVLNYLLPGLLRGILAKTTPYVVLHSPLGEALAIPLSKETDRLQPFYQTDDVSTLPAGDYYFSVILTVPDGDPLKVDDWYLGTYGRISHERIRISATATDAEDANRDGVFDNDMLDVNGFSDPSFVAQLKEQPIQLNRRIFYPGTPLTLSYALPDRLSQVFSGRANAHLAIKMPDQSALLYVPLAAVSPDALIELLNLPDNSMLLEGDYLLSVIFTRPGGNPADFKDWYMDITPVNTHQRIYISTYSSDDRDADNDGFFDADNDRDGVNDMSQLQQHISGLCPGNTLTCVDGYLPLFIAKMAEMADLLDAFCKNDKVCTEILQNQIIQDAFSGNDSAASVMCPTGDSACVNQAAFSIDQAKRNIQQRNTVFKKICTDIGNPDICQNSGPIGRWDSLYQYMRNISSILRMPLFRQICPDGLKCGANGGFSPLVQKEIEYWQLIADICNGSADEFACQDEYFAASDQAWETSWDETFSDANYEQELKTFLVQEMSTLFCIAGRTTNCPALIEQLVANDGQYAQLLGSICGQDTSCSDLVGGVAFNMAIFDELKQASEAFCQGDIACLTDIIPKVQALAPMPVDDLYYTAYDELYTEVCQGDSVCESQLDNILDLEYNLVWMFESS